MSGVKSKVEKLCQVRRGWSSDIKGVSVSVPLLGESIRNYR